MLWVRNIIMIIVVVLTCRTAARCRSARAIQTCRDVSWVRYLKKKRNTRSIKKCSAIFWSGGCVRKKRHVRCATTTSCKRRHDIVSISNDRRRSRHTRWPSTTLPRHLYCSVGETHLWKFWRQNNYYSITRTEMRGSNRLRLSCARAADDPKYQ